jgi:hypothetical protein
MTSIWLALVREIVGGDVCTCFHDAAVDFQSIEFFGCLGCKCRLRKCEGGNATALTIWAVREFDLLDGSDSL